MCRLLTQVRFCASQGGSALRRHKRGKVWLPCRRVGSPAERTLYRASQMLVMSITAPKLLGHRALVTVSQDKPLRIARQCSTNTRRQNRTWIDRFNRPFFCHSKGLLLVSNRRHFPRFYSFGVRSLASEPGNAHADSSLANFAQIEQETQQSRRRCGHAAEADACFEKGGSKTNTLLQIARLVRSGTVTFSARWWAA